jgi:esterase/lipase
VKAAWQLSLLWKATRPELRKITAPVLVFTSRDDHVVEPENSETVLNEVSSTDKRQIWLEDSFHVATMDNDFPVIAAESLRFIRSHSPASATS